MERSAVSFLHASLRSAHVGLVCSISHIFFARPQRLICFSIDRVVDVLIALVPNEAMAAVIGGETRNDSFPVFFRASPHAIRHSDVKNVRPASDDIDVIVMLSHCFNGLRAK